MNNEKGFYLLLDLGLPIGLTSWPSDIYSKTFTLPGLKTKVQLVYLWDRPSIPRKTTIPRRHGISHSIQDSGRFVFWLRNNKRDDALAQQITDAVWAILAVLHSVPGPAGHTPAALWLPADILRDNLFVKAVDILGVEKQKPPEERITITSLDMVKARLDTCTRFLFSVMDDMWRTVPGVLKNASLFDALHFFQASLREYSFLGDSIGEVLGDRLHGPVSRYDSTRAENAIINAFKAIEAIIGDPPKDDARFESKLREAYIDPAKPFGYRRTDPSEPIFKVIRRLNQLRDKRAAHGRSGADRSLTYFNIMEAQHCAEMILFEQVQRHKKRTRRYLIPGWLSSSPQRHKTVSGKPNITSANSRHRHNTV